jgi:DNA-binding GntR family transcriptional regulator
MILSGDLPLGAQIGEEALAYECGVSRTPVRDALRRLELESFVVRTESQRCFVADWSLDDIDEGFILRGMLESFAARRAAQKASPDQLDQMRHHNACIERAVGSQIPDIDAFLEHNRQFHSVILDAAASPKLSGILARLIEQPIVSRTAHNYDHEQLLRSFREHDELIAAIAKRDGGWAESIMLGHIRRAFHTFADAHGRQRAAPDLAAA